MPLRSAARSLSPRRRLSYPSDAALRGAAPSAADVLFERQVAIAPRIAPLRTVRLGSRPSATAILVQGPFCVVNLEEIGLDGAQSSRRRRPLASGSRRRARPALTSPRFGRPDFGGRFAAERSGRERELANDGKSRRVRSRADRLGFLRRPSGMRLLRRAGPPDPAARQASCAREIRRGAVPRLRRRRRCCSVGALRGDTQ